jgi:hypothetical protein
MLGKHAFQNCLSLESIVIPASVRSIPLDCFVGCHSFFSITFEAGSDLSVDSVSLWDCAVECHPRVPRK